jgi:nucleotide-binding universal stress UspA family protein
VFHPSDFSEASRAAFVHALAVVLFRQADLTVMHVVPEGQAIDDWTDSPGVRETLERWGLLEKGSARADVFGKLSIRVGKINVRSGNPLKSIIRELEKRPADLVVLATEGRDGLPRWINPSVAESVARRTDAMTLFVPARTNGFVSPADGKISIRRILIPVDHKPGPGAALTYATRVAVMSHEETVELVLLRVGDETSWPELELPELRSCTWEKICRSGKVVDEIVKAAEERSADLIVMATEGTTGILDALRGSVTEQVIRAAPCPVLAVPTSRN